LIVRRAGESMLEKRKEKKRKPIAFPNSGGDREKGEKKAQSFLAPFLKERIKTRFLKGELADGGKNGKKGGGKERDSPSCPSF